LSLRAPFTSHRDGPQVSSPEQAGIVLGQKLDVFCMGQNEKGQVRLSRRRVLLAEQDAVLTKANGRGADGAAAVEAWGKAGMSSSTIAPMDRDSVVQTETSARVYRPRS
jgi:hypothetical protein